MSQLSSFKVFITQRNWLRTEDWEMGDDRNPFTSLRDDLETPGEVIICLTSEFWWYEDDVLSSVMGGWGPGQIVTHYLCVAISKLSEVWKLISSDPVLYLHRVANSNLFSLWIQSSRNSCNNKTLKFSFLISTFQSSKLIWKLKGSFWRVHSSASAS